MSITSVAAIALLSGTPDVQAIDKLAPNIIFGSASAIDSGQVRPVGQSVAERAPDNPPTDAKTEQAITPEAKASGPAVDDGPQSAQRVPGPPQLPGTQSESVAPTTSEQGIIVVTANQGPPAGDPIAVVNEASFDAAQTVDEAIMAPIADGYQKNFPEPIRDGVHNVLKNIEEPIVFVNFLLQLKIGKALETAGRFAINSTVGVAGLFDVAKKKPFKLPRRPNGLADTLGFYGVGPGPYLFLPLIGSTTVRDLFGRVVELSLWPSALGKPFTKPFVSISRGVLSAVDERVQSDEIVTRVQQSGNPYAAMREYYLKKRQAEIDVLKGKRSNSDINLEDLEFMDSLPSPKAPPK